MNLTLLAETYAVSRPDSAPDWLPSEGFMSLTRTHEEISVVCEESRVPRGVRSEPGWRAFQLAGPIPFSMTGVLASLLTPLAQARIPIFAVSTFDTDYVLVREADLAATITALEAAGHAIAQPDWRIEPATDMSIVRELFGEYWREFGFTPCFQNFAAELESLPSPYEALAVAWSQAAPAGCIAYKRVDERACEAKRLFVRPAYRGKRIGRELLEWAIRQARRAGYEELVGDTMPVMRDALGMYERRGFQIRERDGVIYLRLPL